MANQNFNTFGRGGVIADQATFDAGLRAHMIRVYNYMASGLALSGIVAFALFSSRELAGLFFQVAPGNRVVGLNILGWIAIFAPFGLLLLDGLPRRADERRRRPGDLLGGHRADGRQPVAAACSATPAPRSRAPSS